MSTDFSDQADEAGDWMSQAEAARLHGVSRQAIHKLVRAGRFRTKQIGGHVLVYREDVVAFRPRVPGRPLSGEDTREFDRIKVLLESCRPSTLDKVEEFLRGKRPRRAIESRLGADAEVILDALDRAGDLTIRMFRGILAEAAFNVHVVGSLTGWRSEPVLGNPSFDFELRDHVGPVRVQVKLQRSERGEPVCTTSGHYLVETQRTRGGTLRGPQEQVEKTRPYRYGQFDLLAVSLQPSTGRWDRFLYTLGRWLLPSPAHPDQMATFQPVATVVDTDWTDDFSTCVAWLRSGVEKQLRGDVRRRRPGEPTS
jgi:excisionase family DNA binding protein